MIVGAIGRVFRWVAVLRPGDAGRDLDHVGAELVRLERRAPSRPASSR